MTLKNLLTTPFQRSISKGFVALLFVIAVLGFIDASYLTVEHFINKIPPCSIGSCETVLTSSFATVLGIPVALGGALFYLTVLIFLMVYIDTKKEVALKGVLLLTIPGFIFSLYLVILQAVVLHAFCIYCMGSATTSTLLFISAITIYIKHK